MAPEVMTDAVEWNLDLINIERNFEHSKLIDFAKVNDIMVPDDARLNRGMISMQLDSRLWSDQGYG